MGRKEKVLSVVIPSYNIQQYINQCLESLIQTEEILDQLDIVVVNDGSKDDTVLIAQKYVDQYPNSIRIIDKENGGHGSVLNVGIREARGKYIKILDGDDWVDKDGFRNLVEYLGREDTDADFVLNPYEVVEDGTGNRTKADYSQLETGKAISFRELNERHIFIAMHAMTVRVGLYRENPIPAIDEHIFYVDMEYDLYPLPYVKKMVFLPDVVYQYRVGTAGQSVNIKNMIARRQMHSKVIDSLHTYYKTAYADADQELKQYFLANYEATLEIHTEILLAMDDHKTAKAEMKEMIQRYTDILQGRYQKKKIQLLVRSRCVPFGMMSLYYRKVKKLGE